MGTTWSVKTSSSASAGDLTSAVETVLADVDAKMSTWRDDSELAAVRVGSGPVDVSLETAEVVLAALALAERTGGAYDPTVQPLMELWGFHEPRATWPTDQEIDEATRAVSWGRVSVDVSGNTATVDAGGTSLDLSSIAKGHAVDRVSEVLVSMHSSDHLVEVGGEVRVMGRSASGDPWLVGIEQPTGAGGFVKVLSVTDAAVATSGNYRNLHVLEGREVPHTMDPRTGRPATSAVLSATVVGSDCMTADGWATALMVLGVGGLGSLERVEGLEALVLIADSRGDEVVSMTSGMHRFLPP
jgi:thiamine biosynthesis lipoprotein